MVFLCGIFGRNMGPRARRLFMCHHSAGLQQGHLAVQENVLTLLPIFWSRVCASACTCATEAAKGPSYSERLSSCVLNNLKLKREHSLSLPLQEPRIGSRVCLKGLQDNCARCWQWEHVARVSTAGELLQKGGGGPCAGLQKMPS